MKYLLFEMNYYKNHFQFTQNQIKAIRWSQENGKCFGAGTNNWSDSNFLIIPFNKLKSNDPVLVISEVLDSEIIDSIMSIKLATEQIAIAYQHLLQKQKTAYAEAQAHEEAIKSALLASIAHDMRTPLTSILGAATTLNQDEISFNKVEIKHLTAIITSQAKHLARTTENILSLIRLESMSKDTIEMDIQSPEEIVGILADLYQYQPEPIQLSINVEKPDLLIKANGTLVVLALINLVENARQANIENNCPQAKVEVIVKELSGKVFMQVHDSGPGFPAGFDITKIKKFESSRDNGFGLGLSIVEAVANLHQAELIFDKNKSNGAIVNLIFNKADLDIDNVG